MMSGLTSKPEISDIDRKSYRFSHAVSQDGVFYLVAVPPILDKATRVLVTVHGISRNVEEHARLFAEQCLGNSWLVVAPLFAEPDHHGYQRLDCANNAGALRSDEVLNNLLAEVAVMHGVDTRSFCLFGFSGGAQFSHRYTLLHPQRVSRLALASAGYYTFPDREVSFPRGLRIKKNRHQLVWQLEAAFLVPTAVFVGETDCLRDASLRTGKRVDAQQGVNRVKRAEAWVRAIRLAVDRRGLETPVSLTRLADCSHDFDECMKRGKLGAEVLSFFQRPVADGRPLSHHTSSGGDSLRFVL